MVWWFAQSATGIPERYRAPPFLVVIDVQQIAVQDIGKIVNDGNRMHLHPSISLDLSLSLQKNFEFGLEPRSYLISARRFSSQCAPNLFIVARGVVKTPLCGRRKVTCG